jgi:hypothetical protein
MTDNLKTFAKMYWKFGLNIACGKNELTEYNFYANNIIKSPYHAYEELLTERQDLDELELYDWENAVTIGTITGFNNLISLDIDECLHYEYVQELLHFLNLPSDYEWVIETGSHAGFQILFYIDHDWLLPEFPFGASFKPKIDYKDWFERIEVLRNVNVVLPPSVHSSGSQYSFKNCVFPKSAPKIIPRWSLTECITIYTLSIPEYGGSAGYLVRAMPIEMNNFPDYANVEYDSLSEKELWLVFDIETDGLIENHATFPYIIQIAWQVFDRKGSVIKRKCELISDNDIDTNKAYNINKIDINLCKKIGKPLYKVLKELWLDMKHTKGIIAHNLDFDLSLLKYYFEKNNILFDFSSIHNICTMLGGAFYLQGEKYYFDNTSIFPTGKYPKLIDLYTKLFRTIHERHNAQFDSILTKKCFIKLGEKDVIIHRISSSHSQYIKIY